jgi:hypothetical protein
VAQLINLSGRFETAEVREFNTLANGGFAGPCLFFFTGRHKPSAQLRPGAIGHDEAIGRRPSRSGETQSLDAAGAGFWIGTGLSLRASSIARVIICALPLMRGKSEVMPFAQTSRLPVLTIGAFAASGGRHISR